MIDFEPLFRREKTIQQLADGLTQRDLRQLTNEMIDLQLAAIANSVDEDFTAVLEDPDADDPYAADASDAKLSWTLGHVVVHTTASSEEAAAQALTLARGLKIEGRSRYEVPWHDASSAAFARHRLEESRRMRIAMLDAWPDQPHLDNLLVSGEGRPGLNAIARFLHGLSHDQSHLEQMRKIVGQRQQIEGAPAR